jgi:hypothetical protein
MPAKSSQLTSYRLRKNMKLRNPFDCIVIPMYLLMGLGSISCSNRKDVPPVIQVVQSGERCHGHHPSRCCNEPVGDKGRTSDAGANFGNIVYLACNSTPYDIQVDYLPLDGGGALPSSLFTPSINTVTQLTDPRGNRVSISSILDIRILDHTDHHLLGMFEPYPDVSWEDDTVARVSPTGEPSHPFDIAWSPTTQTIVLMDDDSPIGTGKK